MKGKKVPLDTKDKNGEYLMPILFGTSEQKCQGVTY